MRRSARLAEAVVAGRRDLGEAVASATVSTIVEHGRRAGPQREARRRAAERQVDRSRDLDGEIGGDRDLEVHARHARAGR